MAQSRRVNHTISSGSAQQVRRNVTLADSPNLNIIFSTLSKANNKPAPSRTGQGSVFSRIGGGGRGGNINSGNGIQSRLGSNIASRLGKPRGGRVQKHISKNGPSSMEGIERPAARQAGKEQRNKPHSRHQNSRPVRGRGNQRGGRGRGGHSTGRGKGTKPTSEDLDKALDTYMMKDPKTAQARLDEELNSYMAENEDTDMN